MNGYLYINRKGIIIKYCKFGYVYVHKFMKICQKLTLILNNIITTYIFIGIASDDPQSM